MISALSYELEWRGDIVNGEEFSVDIVIEGEEGKLYDGKLWIENGGNIISERYDPKNENWKSGYYYINEYFKNGKQEIKIRINKKYEDFKGEAYINFRIRNEKEIKKDIIVKKANKNLKDEKEEKKEEKKINEELVVNEIKEVKDEVYENVEIKPIILGKNLNDSKNAYEKILYESNEIKMINYSLYGFVVLCVLLCIAIIWRKI
jgi:hypothetical protein